MRPTASLLGSARGDSCAHVRVPWGRGCQTASGHLLTFKTRISSVEDKENEVRLSLNLNWKHHYEPKRKEKRKQRTMGTPSTAQGLGFHKVTDSSHNAKLWLPCVRVCPPARWCRARAGLQSHQRPWTAAATGLLTGCRGTLPSGHTG